VVEEGGDAPDFELTSDAGERVKLSQFRGRPVVLYFYPRDNTPGCTTQACGIRDAWAAFEERGTVVLGVSPDDVGSHAAFKAEHRLPFTLLSDPDHDVAELYGAWGEEKLYGKTRVGMIRSTYVIGPDGTLVKAMPNVRPDGHAERVLAALPG
jgi:thioredoxin-dependent peroxiredoxin